MAAVEFNGRHSLRDSGYGHEARNRLLAYRRAAWAAARRAIGTRYGEQET